MNFIQTEKIISSINQKEFSNVKINKEKIREILIKAKELQGLDQVDVLDLMRADSSFDDEIYEAARFVKQTIYGSRMVLFAPLYTGNLCNNDCTYCAFSKSNKELKRKNLNPEEIKKEIEVLLSQGHKRILMVAGEENTKDEFDRHIETIKNIYSVKTKFGSIRRININIAPLSVENFSKLFKEEIGTYQCFQETYHEDSYKGFHPQGKKSDFLWRLNTMDRAFQGGGQDLGIGVLFGLYDWKFEVLALMNHIKHLEKTFGLGPHTISIPRIEPAEGSELSLKPPYAVNDSDFKKIIALLRMAVPYTGIILSTRENQYLRRECFELGVSQISAGSRTNPGGYSDHTMNSSEQFSLGDNRPLNEVVEDIVDQGHIPSFCTGCYRMGRVGKDFMDMAKPGLIRSHCDPNAVFTFTEYLEDFATPQLKIKGYQLIDKILGPQPNNKVVKYVERLKNGERDLYF